MSKIPTPNTPKSTPLQIGMSFTFIVLYLSALSAFGSFVNDMYTPSLPSMSRFFHCSPSTSQMGLTTGMIGLALGQILLGPFSLKYGRKPALIASLIIFLIAAAISVFSPTIHFFLVCRFFQGIGASGGYFLARTIPADVYMGRQLAKCMAVMGGINGFAPACAPVLGGIIADAFTWKGVFVALAAICTILLCITPMLKETMPKWRRPEGSVWADFRNYPRLLRNRPFMIHCLLKGAALGFLFAYISSAPFIFQDHFGWSKTMYGVFVGANALFVAGGSMLALRFRPLKNASRYGSLLLLVTTVAESLALWFVDSFWCVELLFLPVCLSLGMIFTATNTLAMNEGRTAAGAASALLGVIGYIFGAIVAPLVGIGNILHSTAIVLTTLALLTFLISLRSRRLPADLLSDKK